MKVLVLSGGTSNEREISLRSGTNIVKALESAGHTVVSADPSARDFDLARLASQVDIIFPVIHGAGGEDGALPKQLAKIGKPYLGSDADSCQLTFDKVRYKELLAENGILTPVWEIVDRAAFNASGLLHDSYVLKPIAGGSSIDTFVVHNPNHQAIDPKEFDRAFGQYGKMLLEQLIEGHEVTAGVLGEQALPLILIIPPRGEEFDYANKYNGKTQEVPAPPQIPAETQKTVQELALKIHLLTGCRHFTRTDMIIADNGAIYVLETNTVPGLTEQSLFPKAAAAAGIDITQLVDRFIALASGKSPK